MKFVNFKIEDNVLLYEESKIARRARPGNPSTGRGGAPKFSKNWLPFACSPYDPDHIFALLYPPTAPGGGSLSLALLTSPNSYKHGNI